MECTGHKSKPTLDGFQIVKFLNGRQRQAIPSASPAQLPDSNLALDGEQQSSWLNTPCPRNQRRGTG